ncbi:MAG: DUF2586 family protein [Candidatus Azobacteroides sp.]|nr:DUF2586 family protein [Candidatus Azobacteroides sp.]
MLPGIKIEYKNGNLGIVNPSADGLLGLICTGVSVDEAGEDCKFALNEVYSLRKLSDLLTLGITGKEKDKNANVVKLVKEFYTEAEEGTKVFLMVFPQDTTISEMLDWNEENSVKKLLNYANGEIRGLIVSGTDPDMKNAMEKAQNLGEKVTKSKYAPIFTILEGCNFNGIAGDLPNLAEYTHNRVGVFIGDSEVEIDKETGSKKSSALGLLAGRIAKIPVQRNIGRVKDGAVATVKAYIGDVAVESADPESIHDKGYITFRTFTGRSGYFFSDDVLATDSDDDYCFLARRRTIDKAYRIVYNTLIDELMDEIPVNEDGTLQAAMVRSWQGKVESAVARQMTANGELSADPTDPNDKGVICEIDSTQNVVSTSRIDVNVKVRPFGYARYIEVHLGFTTVTA